MFDSGRRMLSFMVAVGLETWLGTAHAALGGDAASITADAAQLNGVAQSMAGTVSSGTVITIDNGIRITEYTDAGRVFAVCWSGPAVPDLRVLLGVYFPAYTAGLAALANPGRKRAVQIENSNLVVRTDGHLRAYSGVAYLRDLLPGGMKIEMLR